MNHSKSFHDLNVNTKLFSGTVENSIVDFLRSNDSDIGWGEYKDAPFNIKISSTVISALNNCPHEKSDWIINKVLGIRNHLNKSEINTLNIHELGSLYEIIILDKNSSEIKKAIQDEILQRSSKLEDGYSSITVLLTSISAIIKAELTKAPIFTKLLKLLIESQNPNGSWGKEENHKILTTNTAKSIIYLSKIQNEKSEKYLESIDRGIEFLKEFTAIGRTTELADKIGFYQLMLTIQAISNDEKSSQLIDSSVKYLAKNINNDGGIGTLPNQPSNNELTALLLYTFHHIGYFKYIPLRIAKNKIDELENENNKIQSELRVLQKQFDQSVNKEVNHIINENKNLNLKIRELEKHIHEIRKSTREEMNYVRKRMEYDIISRQKYYSRDETNGYTKNQLLFSALALISIIILITLDYLIPNKLFLYSAGGVSLGLLSYLSLLYFNQYRNDPDKIIRSISFSNNLNDSLSYFRRRFVDIMSDMPPSIREEMIYRLSSEFRRIPKDILPRYFEELSIRLNLPNNIRKELYYWLEELSVRDEDEIKVVFDQLRSIL